MRCEMGTVLRTPPGLQPRCYEPFVIVDPRLRIQAISHHAEVMLSVCRPSRDQPDFAGLVQRAVGGSRLAARAELYTVRDPGIEVVARIACCGPPAAAVLILTPLRTPRARRPERAQRSVAVAEGSLAG